MKGSKREKLILIIEIFMQPFSKKSRNANIIFHFWNGFVKLHNK